MNVLYCDNQILVAVKPPNMPSQADASGDLDMLTALKEFIGIKYAKPGNVYLGLVHRLDRPAGGVMVFARTSKAAARLGAQFADHAQGRRYLAVVKGGVPAPFLLVDWLAKGADGMVRVSKEGDPLAKRAELRSVPLACRNGLTLLDVELATGRAHQIRVQHANAGYPLWGDARYGGGKPGEQLALWAYSLSFQHPTRDEILKFAKMPPEGAPWEYFHDIIVERFANEEG